MNGDAPPDRITAGRLRDDELVQALLGRCRFPVNDPGARDAATVTASLATCAVSGGADSSALLILAVAAGFEVTAVHVDHGLREGSDAESAAVADLARRLGATWRAVTATVEPGPDLEARARATRHAALPDDVWFGHTADDQAETVLLRLMRGTGPTGLAAMRSERHPILGLRRRDTEELCARFGVVPFMDPSNRDSRFRRNRVRHEVLPLMDSVADRDVTPLLCRLAELCADQADLLGELAALEDPADAKRLAALPTPVAAEVIRQWWSTGTGLEHPPDAAATARILDVASGRSVSCQVGSGWTVRRRAGRLSLQHVGP